MFTMNSTPISLVTSVISYLPDQDAYRVAGVSRSFQQASYAGRIWIKRLTGSQWQTGFFLPPAGAGTPLEMALCVYNRFIPISDRPYYAYRQLLMADAHPDLADRYPHVVPEITMLRTRVRTERWMGQYLPSARSWRLVMSGVSSLGMVYILTNTGFYFKSIFTGEIPMSFRLIYETNVSMLSVYQVSVMCANIVVWGVAVVVFGVTVSEMPAMNLLSHRIVHHINGPLATVAGRVAEFVTLGQLVAQRAFQTITCKVRVMIRRYWS